MRLLLYNETGELSFHNFGVDEKVPPYAILSHTWGTDAEEVTFEDLVNGSGEDKLGYRKIRFCGEQAKQDGLKYFWIDTCCINKANHAEHSHAINSMFRWYGNATRCYVFLSDVYDSPVGIGDESGAQSRSLEFWIRRLSTWFWMLLYGLLVARLVELLFSKHKLLSDKRSPNMALKAIHNESDSNPWNSEFLQSRWFTRGWTLQELLAPRSVEFFSLGHRRLGDKNSLKEQIQAITGIPSLALEGARLSQFGIDERFKWIDRRQTKLPEDKVYSLLGIFDVDLPLLYGEGAANAFKRVREIIDKRERCIQDLCITDPYEDKKRIEDTKGGLLKDSYRWILENFDFQRWRSVQQGALLWIKGDPGKGKTMLLCGIIDELDIAEAKTALLSYFFCQAPDPRINSATAVLRGLIHMLVRQQPSLVSHVRKKYDEVGKKVFEDTNAFFALSEIFINILRDPTLGMIYIVIDALDECVKDLPKLLRLIVEQSSTAHNVKWVISSRNWPQIAQQLEEAEYRTSLSLELNAESVSMAVEVYIKNKVLRLAQQKSYNSTTQHVVWEHLLCNAENTFLWVALVCEHLEKVDRWNVSEKLSEFPPGLNPLYARMLEQIRLSDSADLCEYLLAAMSIVYRPVSLIELTTLGDRLIRITDDVEATREVISLCGSFLTIRDSIIYFVHQSAKDFLRTETAQRILPTISKDIHHAILTRSLHVLTNTLRRDIYDLQAPGYSIEQVRPPNPDPLARLQYACIYWVDHICDWLSADHANSQNNVDCWRNIHTFIKEKYLYWLEALSLCRSMSAGVLSMAKLEASVSVSLGPTCSIHIMY
jgi:hypothetical protein